MKLLNPSPGECFDRFIILQLKIKHGKAKGKPTEDFVDETRLVWNYLVTTYPGLPAMSDLVGSLREVHEQLWDAITEQRRLYKISKDNESISWSFSEIRETLPKYFKLVELNDRRSELIAKINQVVLGSSYEMSNGVAYEKF
jgi:hypothetical protein